MSDKLNVYVYIVFNIYLILDLVTSVSIKLIMETNKKTLLDTKWRIIHITIL